MSFGAELIRAVHESVSKMIGVQPLPAAGLVDEFAHSVIARFSFAYSRIRLNLSGQRLEDFERLLLVGAKWRVKMEAPIWKKAIQREFEIRSSGIPAGALPAPTPPEIKLSQESMETWVGMYHKWAPTFIAVSHISMGILPRWRAFAEAISSAKWVRLPSGWHDAEELAEMLKTEMRKRGRRKAKAVRYATEVIQSSPVDCRAGAQLFDVAATFLVRLRSWQVSLR